MSKFSCNLLLLGAAFDVKKHKSLKEILCIIKKEKNVAKDLKAYKSWGWGWGGEKEKKEGEDGLGCMCCLCEK
jgi:hypothetical protein